VEEGWPRVVVTHLLSASDVVVLLLPLTSGTRRLVGPSALRLMRSGAFLVNVGRGSVVDASLASPQPGRA